MTPFERAERAQRAAADPASSVFVTANAGSGKTKVLIDRVARLLLAGADPAACLCITYTKAAAAEMQRRLFERLGGWCIADAKSLRESLAALGEAAQGPEALAKARRLFARALETPGGLRIQTIHAFCERLIARFPLEAGVAPGFQVADEAQQARLIAEAWTEAAGDPAVAEALERLCGRIDANSFEAMLTRLMEHRGALAAAAGQDLEAAVARVIARHGEAETEAALRAEATGRAPWADLREAEAWLSGQGKRNRAAAERIAQARARPEDFEAYLGVFLRGDALDEPHLASPTEAARRDNPFLGRLFEQETARLLALLARLRARERAEDSAAALRLGAAVAEAYAAAKARAGLLDFEDLISHAKQLLRESDAAAWVLYKLDAGVAHILVDEGQDTSPEQWELLEPLQAEFFAGEGAQGPKRRTVFAVGDPKQSIYSFQGADPAKFLAEAQALSRRAFGAGQAFAAPALEMSFRSAPEILQLVDAVFSRREIAAGGPPGIFDETRHSAKRQEERGLVEWWPAAPKPPVKDPNPWDAPLDQENSEAAPASLARAVARTIRDWIASGEGVWEQGRLRPMRAGDVLVLVRKRGGVFRAMLRALKREGLAVAGADRITLLEELAVQDLLALARTALDPRDDLSLACVLKSPLVGLGDDDQDLFPLAHGRRPGEALIDRLRAAKAPRFVRAAAFVEQAIAARGASPYGFFAQALERFDAEGVSGWRRMAERLGPEAKDPLEEMLARALAAPGRGEGALWAFLAGLEEAGGSIKREAEEAGETIRVMTVHGAKGLEAPVVFLADASGGSEGPREGLFLAEDGPVWSPGAKRDDAVAAALRAERAQAEQAEHLRLLYVALTRARDRLIVCGPAHGQGEGRPAETSWHALVERAMEGHAAAIETPFGSGWRLGAPQRAEKRAPAPSRLLPLTPAWMAEAARAAGAAPPPPTPAPAPRPGLQANARFRRGKLIHGLLQRLPELAAERRAALGLAWLGRQGCPPAEGEALLGEALNVLNDPVCAPAFGPGSRAEQPILGAGVRGVVDRLRITPEAVWLIDFKTDRPAPERLEDIDPAYIAQLGGYRAALLAALPGREVNAVLIWTQAPRATALPDHVFAA